MLSVIFTDYLLLAFLVPELFSIKRLKIETTFV